MSASNHNKNCQIHHGDCIAYMQAMQNNGQLVHHIITDPPYAISQDNHFGSLKNPRAGVDFGAWDREFDPCFWLPFAMPLLHDNGSLVIFCSYRFISLIGQSIESLGGVVKDVMVWQKTNPMPRNIRRRYVQDMEFILWAVKSRRSRWVFNKPENKPYQRGFFQTPTLLGKERTKHPTQKPLALMQEIIGIHSQPHETIFDPFMGTGSTGAACLSMNRAFIGCEQNQQWFNVAKERLNS